MSDWLNNISSYNLIPTFGFKKQQSEDTLSIQENTIFSDDDNYQTELDSDIVLDDDFEYEDDFEDNSLIPLKDDDKDIFDYLEQNGDSFFNMFLYRQTRPLSTLLLFAHNEKLLKSNKDPLKKDKYFHARANAQAGQNFDIISSLTFSFGREAWDLLRKNTWEKHNNYTFESVLKDCITDIEADIYGLAQGISHPFSDVDSILDEEYLRNLSK